MDFEWEREDRGIKFYYDSRTLNDFLFYFIYFIVLAGLESYA